MVRTGRFQAPHGSVVVGAAGYLQRPSAVRACLCRHVTRHLSPWTGSASVAAVDERCAAQAGPGDLLFLKGNLSRGMAGERTVGICIRFPFFFFSQDVTRLLDYTDVLPKGMLSQDNAGEGTAGMLMCRTAPHGDASEHNAAAPCQSQLPCKGNHRARAWQVTGPHCGCCLCSVCLGVMTTAAPGRAGSGCQV